MITHVQVKLNKLELLSFTDVACEKATNSSLLLTFYNNIISVAWVHGTLSKHPRMFPSKK